MFRTIGIRSRHPIVSVVTTTPRLVRSLSTVTATATPPPPIVGADPKAALKYCMDYVQKYDSDHFVTTLLLPVASRAAVFGIRAFNVECALIPDRARDARLAQLRMMWWKNTILDAINPADASPPAAEAAEAEEVDHTPKPTASWGSKPTTTTTTTTTTTPAAPVRTAAPTAPNAAAGLDAGTLSGLTGTPVGGVARQPIAQVLALASRRHKWTTAYFERMIDSREALLTSAGGDQFASIEHLGRYAEHSVSSVLYLTLESMGLRYSESDAGGGGGANANAAAFHAAGHVGKAIGITTLLRGLPYHFASSGQLMIPKSITDKHKLDVTAMRTALGSAASQAPRPSDASAAAAAAVAAAAASAGSGSRPTPVAPRPAHNFTSSAAAIVDAHRTELAACVYELACEAKAQLHEARALQSALPKGAAAALLPAVGADRYLDALQATGFDVWHPALATTASRGRFEPLLLRTSLAWNQFRGTF